MKTIAEPDTETVQGRGGVPGRGAVRSSALDGQRVSEVGTPLHVLSTVKDRFWPSPNFFLLRSLNSG